MLIDDMVLIQCDDCGVKFCGSNAARPFWFTQEELLRGTAREFLTTLGWRVMETQHYCPNCKGAHND